MKSLVFGKGWIIVASLVMLALPAIAGAEAYPANPGQPPVAQQLVREGDLAIKLTEALGLGVYDNETEAESVLANAGIAPRNGWIADYPVTPDIVGELETSVAEAADARAIPLDGNEALLRLREVIAEMRLSIVPDGSGQGGYIPTATTGTYPDTAALDNYYAVEGPPVVTYYAPPPYYTYLYSWVPYPFWCSGLWFGGFFVLNDFHRPFYYGNRSFFVSNHFHDFGANRVYRVDPLKRTHGGGFTGIGTGNRHHGVTATGVPRGGGHVSNGHRSHASPAIHGTSPAFQGGSPGIRNNGPVSRNGGQAFHNSGRTFSNGTPAVQRGNPASGNGGRFATMPSPGTRVNSPFVHTGMRGTGSPSFGSSRAPGPTSFGGGRSVGPASFGGGRGGGAVMHGGSGGSFGRSGGAVMNGGGSGGFSGRGGGGRR